MIEELNPNTSITRHRDKKLEERHAMTREATGIPFAPAIEQLDNLMESITPAVGDPNSQERGTGARWNAGKVPYDMLPVQLLNDWMARMEGRHGERIFGKGTADEIVAHIGSYQAGSDTGLDMALAASADTVDPTRDRLKMGLERYSWAAQVFQHVTTRKEKPYPKWNWTKGMAWSVPIGCILRHAQAIQRGEEIDLETGYPHMAHIQCNLIMLLLYRETYKEGDDRPPKEFLPA